MQPAARSYFQPSGRDSLSISIGIIMDMRERKSLGRNREGWKNGGETQLLLLIGQSRFPWLTRSICSVDLKRGMDHEQSSRAGKAAGLEEVG